MSAATTTFPQIGSVVRVPLLEKLSGRGTVATVDGNVVSVLMHDSAPQPLHNQTAKFIVTPMLEEVQSEEETTLETNQIKPLLDFEKLESDVIPPPSNDVIDTVKLYKQHGDDLMRLGDAGAAVSWYEAALSASSHLQVGSVGILLKQGRAVLCDVDCIEDDNMVDVTITSNEAEQEEEMTISKSKIIVFLLNQDDDSLQERILLNLARCLLQLASLKDATTQNRPLLYRKGAVLACTLCLEILSYDNNENGSNDESSSNSTSLSLQESALLLRAKAQAGRHQYKHALQDVKKLLKTNPNSAEGRKLLSSIEKQQILQSKTNKRLAKEVCKWVDKASRTPENDDNKESSMVSEEEKKNDAKNAAPDEEKMKNKTTLTTVVMTYVLIPVVMAWLWRVLFQKG